MKDVTISTLVSSAVHDRLPPPVIDIQQDSVTANRLKISFGKRRTRLKSEVSNKTVFQKWRVTQREEEGIFKFYMQALQWIQIHTQQEKTKQILRWYVTGKVMEFMAWIYQLSYRKFWIVVFKGKNHSWEDAAFHIHMSRWCFACQLPWNALSKTASVMFYGN